VDCAGGVVGPGANGEGALEALSNEALQLSLGVMQPPASRTVRTFVSSPCHGARGRERSLRRSLRYCLWASIGLAACDPAWHMAIRQPIAPLTTQECIANALRMSPHVDSVHIDRYSFGFTIPDSTVPRSRRQGWVEVKHARDSVVLELSLQWRFPAAGIGTSAEHTRYLAGIGRELAERVRAACAAGLPTSTSCRLKGLFMNESCDNPH
jgi:hypothetical protein